MSEGADNEVTLIHRAISGEGATADEAILDWYSKMPPFSPRIWWRVKPELASETSFDTKITRFQVFCRFCEIPEGMPMPQPVDQSVSIPISFAHIKQTMKRNA